MVPVAVRSGHVLSTILRHDAKVTSYKLALIRALNEVVLAFPDALHDGANVSIT